MLRPFNRVTGGKTEPRCTEIGVSLKAARFHKINLKEIQSPRLVSLRSSCQSSADVL